MEGQQTVFLPPTARKNSVLGWHRVPGRHDGHSVDLFKQSSIFTGLLPWGPKKTLFKLQGLDIKGIVISPVTGTGTHGLLSPLSLDRSRFSVDGAPIWHGHIPTRSSDTIALWPCHDWPASRNKPHRNAARAWQRHCL